MLSMTPDVHNSILIFTGFRGEVQHFVEVFIERSCTLPNAIPVKFAKRNAKDQLIAINRGDLRETKCEGVELLRKYYCFDE